jgi:hypothetical protein
MSHVRLEGDWNIPYAEMFFEEWINWNWSEEYYGMGYIHYHAGIDSDVVV